MADFSLAGTHPATNENCEINDLVLFVHPMTKGAGFLLCAALQKTARP